MAALVDRLRVEGHRVEAVRPSSRAPLGSVEIVTLFRELHAATMFEGAAEWRLLAADEHERIEVPLPSARCFGVVRILDLPDGTCIATARLDPDTRVVRLRTECFDVAAKPATPADLFEMRGNGGRPTTQPAAEVPVLEGTLTEILARALDTGGSTDLATSGKTLLDVAPPWMLQPVPTAEERRAWRDEVRARRRKTRRDKDAPSSD
jgi:hypothetical protein